jgi:ATP-dependent DNA ligase
MKPIEVSAMQLTEDGALRHGKFIGFRPDLNIDACTWEKIFG